MRSALLRPQDGSSVDLPNAVAFHVNFEIADNLERPPRGCELVLFRVLQESLTNVHRHSGASTARVRLSSNTGHFTLEISDNGKGISRELLERFAHSGEHAGVGIAGMRARVEELGGGLRIESDTTGTTVTAELPVAPSYTCQTKCRNDLASNPVTPRENQKPALYLNLIVSEGLRVKAWEPRLPPKLSKRMGSKASSPAL